MSAPVILVPLAGSEDALAALPVAKVLGQIAPAPCGSHVAKSKPPDADLLRPLRLQAQDLDGATLDVRTGEPATEFCDVRRRSSRWGSSFASTPPPRREKCWGAQRPACLAMLPIHWFWSPPSGEQHRGVYNLCSSRMTGRPGTALG